MGKSSTTNFESSLVDFPDLIDLHEFSLQCASLNTDVENTRDLLVSNTDEYSFFENLDLGSNSIPTSSSRINNDILEDNMSKYTVFNDDTTTDGNLSTNREETILAGRVARSRLASVGVLSSIPEKSKNISGKESKNLVANLLYENQDQTTGKSGSALSSGDIILSIAVYPSGRNSSLHPMHKQEFEVKGTDSLSVLQEQIYCLSKRIVNELAPNVADENFINTSSFLLIEDTFYDDPMADESRPSDIYLKALKAVGSRSQCASSLFSDPENVRQLSLKLTRWIDLKLRLNRPYLFVHLGGCEHCFIITQVRAFNATTDSNILLPRKTLTLKARRRKCRVCEVYAGSKILLHDKLMHENPCIICEKCFSGFHPENDVGYSDFEIVPYYHEV